MVLVGSRLFSMLSVVLVGSHRFSVVLSACMFSVVLRSCHGFSKVLVCSHRLSMVLIGSQWGSHF